MPAVSANQITRNKNAGRVIHGRAAAVNLYAGTIAYFDASTGFITSDDNAGGNPVAGIVREQVDNSGGSAGDLDVELYTEGIFYLTGSSFTQASVGDLMYGVDNYTIQASATSASKIGRAVEFVSSTQLGVLLNLHG